MRAGILQAAAAYVIWGLFPLYFRLLQGVGALEVLGHRIVWSLLFVALLLVVPGLMVFLSLALPVRTVRWLNIGLALFYAVFVAITMPGAWWFYLAYSGIEILLCAAIIWLAWRWPRTR